MPPPPTATSAPAATSNDGPDLADDGDSDAGATHDHRNRRARSRGRVGGIRCTARDRMARAPGGRPPLRRDGADCRGARAPRRLASSGAARGVRGQPRVARSCRERIPSARLRTFDAGLTAARSGAEPQPQRWPLRSTAARRAASGRTRPGSASSPRRAFDRPQHVRPRRARVARVARRAATRAHVLCALDDEGGARESARPGAAGGPARLLLHAGRRRTRKLYVVSQNPRCDALLAARVRASTGHVPGRRRRPASGSNHARVAHVELAARTRGALAAHCGCRCGSSVGGWRCDSSVSGCRCSSSFRRCRSCGDRSRNRSRRARRCSGVRCRKRR